MALMKSLTIGNFTGEIPSKTSELANDSGFVTAAHLIALLPVDSASGSVASITDGYPAPVEALSVTIKPAQSGSGTPAPDNVRPISGWTEARIWCEATHDTSADPKITVDLSGTRYGGTLDVKSGVLTINKAIIKLDGTQSINTANWRSLTNTRAWNYLRSMTDNDFVSGQTVVPDIMCDSLPTVNYNNMYNTDSPGISSGNGTNPTVGLAIRVADTSLTTKNAINAWLAQHPITVVYPMRNPVTVQLIPAQMFATVHGNNSVWANCGDVAVSYRADIQLYIQKQLGA